MSDTEDTIFKSILIGASAAMGSKVGGSLGAALAAILVTAMMRD